VLAGGSVPQMLGRSDEGVERREPRVELALWLEIISMLGEQLRDGGFVEGAAGGLAVSERERGREPVAKSRAVRKHTPVRAYRTPKQQAVQAKTSNPDGARVARAPKWAQQMYVTPWQSRAFAYTQ